MVPTPIIHLFLSHRQANKDTFIQYLHDLSLVKPELGGVGGDAREVDPSLRGAGFFLGIAIPGSKVA